MIGCFIFFFFKQKTAYEMRISDWSSDVCSSDLLRELSQGKPVGFKLCVGQPWEFMAIVKAMLKTGILPDYIVVDGAEGGTGAAPLEFTDHLGMPLRESLLFVHNTLVGAGLRSEEHTSELQSLMRISYAVFCLKK